METFDKWGRERFDEGPWREDLLASWINDRDFKRVAELGVFDGYTLRNILEKCPDIERLIGVDTWEHPDKYDCLAPKGERSREVYETTDQEANYTLTLKNIEGYSDKVELLKMTTLEASKEFDDGYFDLVFIDADHSYEGVKNDILTWYPKIRKGGLLCGHDFSWDGIRQAIAETVIMVHQTTDDVWVYQKKNF